MTVICNMGKNYSSCVPKCPETCQTNLQQVCTAGNNDCVPGCVCPAGKVEYNGTCISRDTCPCFHDGTEYGERTKIQKGCNTWYVVDLQQD